MEDIEITIAGRGRGEKLYEALLMDESDIRTENKGIRIGKKVLTLEVFPESIAKGSSTRSSRTNLRRATCAESNASSQVHGEKCKEPCIEPSS